MSRARREHAPDAERRPIARSATFSSTVSLLTRPQPDRPVPGPLELEPLGQRDEQLETVDAAGSRADRSWPVDLVALDPPVTVERDLGWRPHGSLSRARAGDEREQRRERRARPARRGRARGPATRPAPRARHRPGRAETCSRSRLTRLRAASSAGGVGTVCSASATTSSARSRCTQSSGRTISLCASAGTATAFTSSGVTKSRPASAAFRARQLDGGRCCRVGSPRRRVAATRASPYEVDDVALDRVGDVHLLERALHLQERRRVDHSSSSTSSTPRLEPPREHLDLVVARRIADRDPHEEPVELGLGQRVRPLLFDRVLGREHEERRLQRVLRRSIVTCRSCIASRSEACVFGGARLISSARRRLAKSERCASWPHNSRSWPCASGTRNA